MHLLAFDTSTDALSVAVMRSTPTGPLYWQHQGVGGAAASGSLIAAILDLLRQADLRLQDLDAICFGSGPGSFTGLRTACSVAQGLAYGAGVPVLPVPSLLALAQAARAAHAPDANQGCVSALLDARMDQVYAATYAFASDEWTTVQAPCLLAPEQVAAWAQSADAALGVDNALLGALGTQQGPANETGLASCEERAPFLAQAQQAAVDEHGLAIGQDNAPLVPKVHTRQTQQGPASWRAWAGNVFADYGERLTAPATVLCCGALPQAMAILQVAPALIKAGACVPPEQALPLYVRDKVAKTTGERALEKAVKAGIAQSEVPSAAPNIAQAAAHAPTSGA